MHYTNKNQKNFLQARHEHDAAIANYAMVALTFLALSPVFVYLFYTISYTTLKISLAFLLLIVISHVIAKLLFHFFENYEKQGRYEYDERDSHPLLN